MEYEFGIYDDKDCNNLLNILSDVNITYDNFKKVLLLLNYSDLIQPNSYSETPLMYLCKNEGITYEILDLFLKYLNPIDLKTKDYFGDTAFIYLCVNQGITYEILDLYISKLKYEDLIIQGNYIHSAQWFTDYTNKTPLMVLCRNPYVTYDMLELFISKLEPEDLYKQDTENNYALNFLVCNNNILINKSDYYKLFINKYIIKEEFIEILGNIEYNKYKLDIDEYFEIVNNQFDLK